MYKFGVSYNVFDGVELLEDSINHIRSVVDHISIIFQTTSYYGEKLTEEEINTVKSLKNRGLVDDLVFFKLDKSISIHQNQINKRNYGKRLAQSRGCTHYMTLDCDEFYTTEEFKKLVDLHRSNPNMITYLPLVAYYKDTQYLIDSSQYMDGDLYVSGFFPVNYDLIMNFPCNVKVDPTRKVGVKENNLINILDKSFIKMHHLSYVRKDIFKKIYNAASKLRYGNNLEHFNYVRDAYLNFEKDGIAISADKHQYQIINIEPEIILLKYYDFI